MELTQNQPDTSFSPSLPETEITGAPSRWRDFLQREGSRTFLIGLALFAIMVGAALAAPLITDHDPSRNNITARLRPP
ncbi:MAG: ABC transporter permease, partial [Thermomicrobiales bacterium]|nr:ABC transporter permease [Thermomicrobiales bacterium]